MPALVYPTNSHLSPQPSEILIPDFIKYCRMKVKVNRNYKRAALASERWITKRANLDRPDLDALRGTKGGLLAAMCYPDCDLQGLRLAADFMNYLFYIDNLTDRMEADKAQRDHIVGAVHQTDAKRGSSRACKLTTDYWTRLIADAGAPTSAQHHFATTFDAFLKTLYEQAQHRSKGTVPDLESYISMRRDNGACRPCFALTACCYRLDIPAAVLKHPIIQNLDDAANDLVAWSNDIFSYNVEQSRGDTTNMIVVVMREKSLSLQEAVDFVSDMTRDSIDRFFENRANLPSWTPEIDEAVEIYVDGLANWIIGSLHWSFESERYFLKDGKKIKSEKVIRLLPRQP
ncbi:hypothetical protein JAAARDRAFT_206626 [Jaapia argillacea MUCL 33604]|uniref:Terpene synthase n=1 Tax=Jaapia argillacea MUCL 33604 TaxID=933084 RepID=A0A067PY27_9AGAM|nr:hypothetical protein JAAARDRAFT_206626 [Jaapia argillacea MUCL 33604]